MRLSVSRPRDQGGEVTILATEQERRAVADWAIKTMNQADEFHRLLRGGENTFGQQDARVLAKLADVRNAAAVLKTRLEEVS